MQIVSIVKVKAYFLEKIIKYFKASSAEMFSQHAKRSQPSDQYT